MDPLIEGQLDWAGLTRERRTLEERWVSASKAPRADTFRAHQSTIYCSFVHEDYIITGGRDQSIRFWKYRSRKDHHMYLDSLCIIKGAHRGSVLCMLADPADAEGQGMMVTGGSDGGVNVWALEGLLGTDRSDTANPKLVRALDKHDAGVLDLAWGPEDLISWSVPLLQLFAFCAGI
jgi:WD40 repeat protein